MLETSVFSGVHAEGLLLEPDRAPVARVVALPDADVSPEAVSGLSSDVPAAAQLAAISAENASEEECLSIHERALQYLDNETSRLRGLAWLLFNLDEFIYVK
jgi:hypothetical protein